MLRVLSTWYHNLKLLEDPEYSFKVKETIWKLNGDGGLTEYGRLRARTCAGGYKGCGGEVIKYEVLENGEFSYESPFCDVCAIEMVKQPKISLKYKVVK